MSEEYMGSLCEQHVGSYSQECIWNMYMYL